ncbi:MAG TPA: ferrous iron transporter B [Gemmatimonadales bacterium]|nr:ferrous iron transporter B [Gemmatimonadales bacterium]
MKSKTPSCHSTGLPEEEATPHAGEGTRTATILVGNPNVGKSVLFKNLTHRYVTVSNFPGTTVEVFRARASFNGRDVEIIDTPGINDLTPSSEDARVTQALLSQHESSTLVQVADAKNLRRSLLLTLQLAELGRPMVLVLNMADELEERGGVVDTDRLSAILGVPVVTTVAIRNEGTDQLIEALAKACPPRLDGPPLPEAQNAFGGNSERVARANAIIAETYSIAQPSNPSFRVRLGFWAMDPLRGLALMAVVTLAVFWFVGLFGAGTLVDVLEVGVFEQRLSPLAIRGLDLVLPFPHVHETGVIEHALALPLSPAHEVGVATLSKTTILPAYSLAPGTTLSTVQSILQFIHDFFVGPYGAITMALSYALAIVLPIVTTFFFVFSILEDSGYFPRMAIMVNKSFRAMGLNGKAVLPMILGLGCDTMATMTTRILETRKERIVTTMLLALAIPCSAQLGVLLALMATLSPAGALVWLGLVVGVIFLVGWLTARVFGGETSEFILEIPPMRRPQLANVLAKTAGRLNWYLREVIPIFIFGTAVLFLLSKLDLLGWLARLGEPIVTGWLGLPKEMANAFLIGFMRRDFGAVYILDAATGVAPVLDAVQILVAMVTITLFMPCFANFLVIVKEHGMKVALSMAAFIFPFAFLVGGLVHFAAIWLLT